MSSQSKTNNNNNNNKPNYENIRRAIDATKGGIFYVKFIKKEDGSIREMVCKRKVKKYLKGGQLPYDPVAYKLLTVFEFPTKDKPGGYKCIPVENIKEIKLNGETFTF